MRRRTVRSVLAVATMLLVGEAVARADIIQTSTGKCVQIAGFSQTAGAPLIQSSCPGNELTLLPTYDGYYAIIANHSGLCLQVEGASQSNGARIVQWGCHYGDHQKLTLGLPDSRGFRRIMVKHSGDCLTVDGGNIADGTLIVQWICHGGFNQKFRILAEPVLESTRGAAPRPTSPGPPGSSGPSASSGADARGGWPAVLRAILAWPFARPFVQAFAQIDAWPFLGRWLATWARSSS